LVPHRLLSAGQPHPVATAPLGEGPSWDPDTLRLTWVEINHGVLRQWRPADGRERRLELGAPLSFAVAREAGGWAVGRRARIALIGPDGRESTLMRIAEPPPQTRFNDARCDAAGRLWAGTMSTVRRPGDGRLYRVDPGGEAVVAIPSTTISNGLDWSPDDALFYFVDSTTQAIDVFDFDLDRGEIANRRRFAAIDPGDGLPDGLTVDAEGGVWVCLYGGGRVRRYDPAGRLDAVFELPVSKPTSLAFGGPRLDRLYVTSALGGAPLELEPGVRGLPANRFPG
jgi:sugar lactone lactonase YvrE